MESSSLIKKCLILIVVYLITFENLHSQIISGTIIDAKTKKEIAYANVGIVGEGIGTVTNTNGRFSLNIAKEYKDSRLRISTLGYKSQDFNISNFNKIDKGNTVILLEEEFEELREITLNSKKYKFKEKILGNKTTSKFFTARFKSDILGNELGTIIRLKRSPTYIEKFNVSIANNDYDNLKFRLNFYSVKKGLPHKNISQESIIVTTDIKKGVLSIDLKDYNIVMTNDFFVSLEWIEDLGRKDLSFSAGLFGNSLVTRKASQGNWKKTKGINVGFNVLTKY